jgi:hypothetical protein
MRRRLLVALGLSLGLHALLLALLLRAGAKPPRPPERRRPMEVEVLASKAASAPRPSQRQPTPGRSGGTSRVGASAAAAPGAQPSRVAGSDAPRVGPDLFPEGALAAALPPPPEPAAPDAGPPQAVVLAGRIQAWRLGSLAEQRVATGVDSYFSTLAHALRGGLGTPPPEGSPAYGTPSAGQRWLQGWLAALSAEDTPPEPPPAERPPQAAEHDLSGRESDLIRRLLGPMAPTQTSLTGPLALFRKTQIPPSAVLRLEQDAEGHLIRTELLASSGDATFDAWVMRSAALALAAVPKPPGFGAGLHPDGTRSDWAFYRQGDGVAVLLLRVY